MKTAAIIIIISIISLVTAFSQVKTKLYTDISNDINSEIAMSKTTDANGNIYCTTTRCSQKDNNIDIVTAKYNSLGAMQWINSYNSFSGNVEAGLTVQLDPESNIIITGKSKTSRKETTSIGLKYTTSGAMINIEDNNNFKDSKNLSTASGSSSSELNSGKLELEQYYPDPFSSNIVIKYCVSSVSGNYVKLNVYDALGNLVHSMVEENPKPGCHELSFERSGLKGGTYYCKMETGNYSSTRKMILIN